MNNALIVFSFFPLLKKLIFKSLKTITDQDYVSLIGESWGGIVVLKMAQILEARGTLVTVFLLEGDPEILTNWGKNFLSNDLFVEKLKTMYGLFYEKVIVLYDVVTILPNM